MTAPQQQKLKVSGPVVVTANRTTDGAVVFWTADGAWSSELAGAAVASTAREAGALLAAASADDLNAVGPYVAPIDLSAGGEPGPGNLRERIRLAGPTFGLPGGARARKGMPHVRL